MVLPKGIEPLSLEPESSILSIELQELTLFLTLANSFANFDFVGAGAKFARMHRNPVFYPLNYGSLLYGAKLAKKFEERVMNLLNFFCRRRFWSGKWRRCAGAPDKKR